MIRFAAPVLALVLATTCEPPPAAWYTFDGCDAADSSGNGRHGQVRGAPDCVPGVLGNALEFDGFQDFVSVSDLPLASAALTVSFWVNPRAVTRPRGVIEHAWDAGTFRLEIAEGEIGGVFNADRGRTPTVHAGPLRARTWHHVAITYDGRMGAAFLNGARVDTVQADRGRTRGFGSVYIGARPPDSFRGILDDVRLYRGALSERAIEALYQEGASER